MINSPIKITEQCFQTAWLEAVKLLIDKKWKSRNLVVHIENPTEFDQDFHQNINDFTEHVGLLGPKHVAYTIFPHKLYRWTENADLLYKSYNRCNGLFERIQKRRRTWGSYFRRLTHYETRNGTENQLDNIIQAIRHRSNTFKAAYTMLIQRPGRETIRPRGGPCLNYLAVQLEPGEQRQLGLLAVYRNHEFAERAYGNYWGLCNLTNFLAKETGTIPGALTCISSRAYIGKVKVELKSLAESYEQN